MDKRFCQNRKAESLLSYIKAPDVPGTLKSCKAVAGYGNILLTDPVQGATFYIPLPCIRNRDRPQDPLLRVGDRTSRNTGSARRRPAQAARPRE